MLLFGPLWFWLLFALALGPRHAVLAAAARPKTCAGRYAEAGQRARAKKAGLSDEDFSTLVAARKSEWIRLEKPLVIKTGKGEFKGRYLIGRGSSLVFLDPAKKAVIKITPEGDPMRLLDYEQLATKFLQEKGYRLPGVIAAKNQRISLSDFPEIRNFPDAWDMAYLRQNRSVFQVLVKDYQDGVGYQQLLSRFGEGRSSFDPLQGANIAGKPRLGKELFAKRQEVSELFTSGQFSQWLEAQGSDLRNQLVWTGDLKPDNWLYSPQDGWTLIDP